jgi:hypothetical protein
MKKLGIENLGTFLEVTNVENSLDLNQAGFQDINLIVFTDLV